MSQTRRANLPILHELIGNASINVQNGRNIFCLYQVLIIRYLIILKHKTPQHLPTGLILLAIDLCWIEPLVKRLGARVIVTDDLASYKKVAEKLGLEHQICQFQVR